MSWEEASACSKSPGRNTITSVPSSLTSILFFLSSLPSPFPSPAPSLLPLSFFLKKVIMSRLIRSGPG